MKKKLFFSAVLMLFSVTIFAQSTVFTFDELTLPDTGYWNGKDTTVYNHFFGDDVVQFNNQFSDAGGYDVWSGFAFSNWTDTVTTGYTNQWSVFAGESHSGAIFGLGYVSIDYAAADYPTIPINIEFAQPVVVDSFFITNSTYTAREIRDGGFSDPFSTQNQDYYKIVVYAINQTDTIDTVEVFLADYRTQDSMVVKQWIPVHFSTRGTVTKLAFDAVTTDVGAYGPNTPLYFCIDDLSYSLVAETREITTENVKIYPNPTTQYINILSDNFQYAQILNLSGQKIAETTDNTVFVGNLQQGIYLVKIFDGNKIKYGKFIKL